MRKLLLLCGLLLGAAATHAAGYARLEVPADGTAPPIRIMVWTPCAAPPTSADIGPYTVQGTPDCTIQGTSLPLVVISHGQGGTLLGHHDTAEALADAGFVVVALNHPGDTASDESAAHRLGIFSSRPHDVSRVITFMQAAWPGRQSLAPGAVGVFGFSRGGYTALALAGAVPSRAAAEARLCAPWWSFVQPLCRQLNDDESDFALQPLGLAGPRVLAVVVVDPLNLFDATGLGGVRVPVQLWASALGGDGVRPEDVAAVRAELPQVPEYHVAEGAGHFAYLAPCDPALRAEVPRICEDPAGFDRVAWHRGFDTQVVAFFRKILK